VQPRRCRLLWLQKVPFETGPALKGIVVPRATCEILIEVKVTVRKDVKASTLLVTNHDCEGILKLLAKADIEHAGVERATPHADVEPAGSLLPIECNNNYVTIFPRETEIRSVLPQSAKAGWVRLNGYDTPQTVVTLK